MPEKPNDLQIRSMPPVKFKDKPTRGGLKINLVGTFGFKPDEILIQKVHGENNKFVVSAVLPPSQLKKELDAAIAKKENKNVDKTTKK